MNDSLDDIESTSSSNYNNNSDSYYSLDEFLPSVCSKDTNARLDIYSRLEEYLKNERTNLHCMDMNQFCNAILAWIGSSNFKISINGLTIIQLLIQRLTEPLRNYSTEIVTVIVDRLADGKEQVRFASKNILIFMMACYTPNFIWDKLTIGFNHKLPKVREETLALLEDTLNKFGAHNLQLNKLVTSIVKLLGDANQFVRDKSFETIIEIYKHVGDKLRADLKKKQLPEAKLKLIFNKFDEVVRNGELKEEAKQSNNNKSSDLVDSTSTSSNNTNTCASLPPTTAKQSSKMIPSSRSNMALLSNNRTGSATGSANQGGIDEETFMNAFETVPKIQIYSAKDLDQQMSQIIDCLSDTENDWVKRVDSLKRIRSLAIACANQYDDEFFACLKQLAVSFTLQIKDLRSQIVREACISIAYLSQCIGHRLEYFVELSMPHLINLIQNSAKIMALSGVVAIRFIIENTHSARLIPLIASSISSRSKEIRRYCCEFLNQLLQTWETYHFEKHVQLIQTCIKKGIADADQEARVFARKAFWSFSSHYPQAADNLLISLDVKTQKLLQNGGQGGTFGSVKSLKDGYSSNNYSANNYNDTVDSGSRYGSVKQNAIHSNAQNTPASKIKRSTSAVDIKNPRTNSALSSRIPVPGDSATSTRSTTSRIPTCINPTPKSQLGSARIAHSQPGSRSTSPTPKYSYLTHSNHGGFLTSPMTINNATNYNLNSSFNNNNNTINNNNNNDLAMTPNGGSAKTNGVYGSANRSMTSSATKSKIPTSSRNSSRESSPGRRSNYGSGYGKVPGRRLFSRQLTNNSDSEQAIANAMTTKYRMKRWDDSDEASETSSICSERSFSSSIGGTRITEDMNEAITCLSSSQWSDRRDGLVNLKNMMASGRIFSRQEIKRLCEIFSKLFHDQHVKVFTLFLDALTDFIRTYKRDLKEWLYVLLTRLLSKIGGESSPSIYHKLCSCLEVTRSSFDLDLQFKILIQFIKENTTQTSNLKVKVAVLKFLQDIICLMEAVDFHTTEDLKHAVCKIVSFTAEPKSVDVRKTAQAVLIALFNLNTPEFSMMLADLPKSIQETASRILKSHINNTNNGSSSSATTTSQSYNSYAYKSNFLNDYINGNASSSNDDSINSGIQLSHVIKDIQNLNMSTQNNHHFNYLTTNNSNNKERLNSNKNDNNKMLDTLSKDSGLQSNGDVDSDSDGAMTSSSTTTTSSIANLPTISSVIATLSNNSSTMSTNEKLKSMRDLTELIKAGNRPECKWNENFKNILFCLFNHLDTSSSENNADQSLAIQTLIALRELLQFQYREFSNYIELTIMKLIEKYKESPPNELSKLVEEVICTAARCLPPEPCARVLKPLIETAEYPKNLIAIRMMQKTIDQMNIDLCSRLLPDILNALLIAWDSPHSPVRKASVFCLVSLYMVIGENLRSHLNNLSSSKIKLLNVYINRAKEAKDPHHQITA